MRILIVTAVEREARAIGHLDRAVVIAGGVGRTNAAAATTEAILTRGPFDAVISAGVAGALPILDQSGAFAATIGEVLVASACVYAEEGLMTAAGFRDMRELGFSLGDFAGNTAPVDAKLLDALRGAFRTGVIATVATCSGTDAHALEIAQRTGAVAEAMEGAAVVHAARRLRIPAIEIRAISNTTGDRAKQEWNLERALRSLNEAMPRIVRALRT